jgi:hypothetical protein
MILRPKAIAIAAALSIAAAGGAYAQTSSDDSSRREGDPTISLVRPAIEVSGAPDDFRVPTRSCLAQPSAPQCPRVDSVTFVP